MRIGIIGAAGNMGRAVNSLLKRNNFFPLLSDTKNVNPSDMKSDIKSSDIELVKEKYCDSITLIENSDVIFICVKPVDMKSVLNNFSFEDRDKLIVSCVAGVSMKTIEKEISAPVIRCMMNLPIATGEGTITYIHNSKVTPVHNYTLSKLLNGPKFFRVEKEKLIDVSTVLSGCLPGFAAYLSDEYINFGIRNGFTYEESIALYTSTMEGTMSMLRSYTSDDIIAKVSSPNGVTVKGIEVLDTYDIRHILRTSVETAYQKFT
jgi:pyrroline-5-carboxylate reductase